jgi:hypothetical protein
MWLCIRVYCQGHDFYLATNGHSIEGRGDASACIQAITTFFKYTNAKCPSNSYCLVNSIAQLQPTGLLFTTGRLATTVLIRRASDCHVCQAIWAALCMSCVVKCCLLVGRLYREQESLVPDSELIPQLTTPTLSAVRTAVASLCHLSWTKADSLGVEERICFDLCQVIAALRRGP